jgi:hypothetical protein
MRLGTGLAVVMVLILLAGTAEAAGRRRVGKENQPVVNKQAEIGAYGRAVYPKYYWGLHAREFQNIGTPHGDIGIRGDGIQMQPW